MSKRPHFALRKTSKALIAVALTVAAHLYVYAQQPTNESAAAIPHGAVHHYAYTTEIGVRLPQGREAYYVYTPPGYDPKTSIKYPVLYLLHGYGENARTWLAEGIDLFLDNLIAEGKVRPMIVVMPSSYGDYKFLLSGKAVWLSAPRVNENTNLFSRMLLTEIIPQVEAAYRVSKKREDRAVAGFSMGGVEAVTIGFEKPDMFAWIGGLNPAFLDFERTPIVNISPSKADFRLLWLSYGLSDRFVARGDERLAAELQQLGFRVTIGIARGGHKLPTAEQSFKQFVPLLFQAK